MNDPTVMNMGRANISWMHIERALRILERHGKVTIENPGEVSIVDLIVSMGEALKGFKNDEV